MEIINKYFEKLNEVQIQKFEKLAELFSDWNSKINLVSRKDMDNLYERHILHSLAIAKVIRFKTGTTVMDVGTGGGFPGIPLAILFPNVDFYLIDSIAKKIKVVKSISEELGLDNVEAEQIRVEDVKASFDFIVSRAVTNLPDFCRLTNYKIHKKGFNKLQNGILYLKGGDIMDEVKQCKKKYTIFPLSEIFEEEFFETKHLVHLY
ncbi:MAG: 16S rRNA (guanine(527)-N(7))-methyltransferase RsmG [Saprospiraceae bacterium]|nr:16S rRNA (guanine(527)-N(7))-methyltransferase RsmG [Saprospiraceae bacterium]